MSDATRRDATQSYIWCMQMYNEKWDIIQTSCVLLVKPMLFLHVKEKYTDYSIEDFELF
jgi:hypothetical protein